MKRLLVVWPVHREDWVRVFKPISKQFDLTFLAGLQPKKTNHVQSFAKTEYWSSFESADHILNEIKPSAIIFMSIDTGLSMLLNFRAKKVGISTFILQHGIYTNYRDYRNREILWRKKDTARSIEVEKNGLGFSTKKFALASLSGTERLLLIMIFAYSYAVKRKGPYWSAKNIPLRMKKADCYLCFSPYNSRIHQELDKIEQGGIKYVGCSELERFLQKTNNSIEDKFYLHLDQALAENSFGEETVSKDLMTSFYLKLNEFCMSKNSRLYIKLHPESYSSNWLPQHENIVYLRNIDNLNSYIQSSKGCFGFYSTMIIPAIYWKPTVLFHIQYSGLQAELKSLFNLPILDFYQFEPTQIVFDSEAEKTVVEKTFINSTNASSAERIIKVLSEKS